MIEELLKIGIKQAELLSIPFSDENMLREKVEELIHERNLVNSLALGLIKEKEAANLILAHFQTKICYMANVSEPINLPKYSNLESEIIGLLKQKW